MDSNFELGPADWAALRALLQTALELDPEKRPRWIDTLGPENESYKPRLRSLLEHAAGNGGRAILDTLPKVDVSSVDASRRNDGRQSGDIVGPYRLLRVLGQGGMGSVWLAERDDMLSKRQVALKLPRLVTGQAQLAERLASEREILAALNHPNIARLYDAGIAVDGQPYLALEYVEGEAIDAYCTGHNLDVTSRLQLFLQVARAVAHAHANLVVHRDLKPSNILVTAAGDVRLLDFGIAKLLEHGEARESEFTRISGRALTPEYSAPEQILGQTITTAADIYALGVLLFELLTGSRPYKLRHYSQAQLEVAIVQADIQRPSSAVTDYKLKKRLRGDLDVIVLKALKKEPLARYATVDGLAEDIERHLAKQPVLAQPDNWNYRLRKFVARNMLAVSAGSAVLAAVLVGAAISVWQANVARTEQHRAEEVKNFITSIFQDADPFNTSAEPTVHGLLNQAEARLHGRFDGQPKLQIELLTLLATGYIGISDFDSADRVLRQAIDQGTNALGSKHALTLRARASMTTVQRFRGRLDDMEVELRSVLEDMQTAESVSPADRVLAVENSAHLAIEQGRYDDAQAAALEARELSVSALGDDDPSTANTYLLVAVALSYGTDLERALEASEQALNKVLALYGSEKPHARVLDARAIHGRILGNLGRYRLAADELSIVVREAGLLLGPDAPMIGYYAADVSRFLFEVGELQDALAYAERSLQVLSPQVQDDTYTMAVANYNIGRVQLALRQPDTALLSLQTARNRMLETRGPDNPATRNVTAHIALAMALQGNIKEAQQEIVPEIENFRNASGLFKFNGLHFAGIVQRLAKDWPAAGALQHEAMTVLDESAMHARRVQAAETELALTALDAGDGVAALEQVRSWLPQNLSGRPATPDDADRELAVGRAYFANGLFVDALPPLTAADRFWQAFAPKSSWASDARRWLDQCRSALGMDGKSR
jgi:serine/threonine-protein kinase